MDSSRDFVSWTSANITSSDASSLLRSEYAAGRVPDQINNRALAGASAPNNLVSGQSGCFGDFAYEPRTFFNPVKQRKFSWDVPMEMRIHSGN